MLCTYSNNISVTANTAIPLNINKILTNNSITHTAGSADIVINSPGYYFVTIDLSTIAPTAGATTIQLYANGTAIPDALAVVAISTTDSSNISFSTILKATPGAINNNVTLTIISSLDLSNTDISVNIHRLA